MTFPADLPDDIDALKALLVAAEAENKALAKRDVIIGLEKLLADFKRMLYDAKSEKGHLDQYHLAIKGIETAMAVVHAEDRPALRHAKSAPKIATFKSWLNHARTQVSAKSPRSGHQRDQ